METKEQEQRAEVAEELMVLKTEYAQKIAERNTHLLADYKRLTSNPENMPTAVVEHLAKKYGLTKAGAYSVLWKIKCKEE